MSFIGRSEHERGPEQHHLAVVAIRERDEALVRAGKAEGEVASLRGAAIAAMKAIQANEFSEAHRVLYEAAHPEPER